MLLISWNQRLIEFFFTIYLIIILSIKHYSLIFKISIIQ